MPKSLTFPIICSAKANISYFFLRPRRTTPTPTQAQEISELRRVAARLSDAGAMYHMNGRCDQVLQMASTVRSHLFGIRFPTSFQSFCFPKTHVESCRACFGILLHTFSLISRLFTFELTPYSYTPHPASCAGSQCAGPITRSVASSRTADDPSRNE